MRKSLNIIKKPLVFRPDLVIMDLRKDLQGDYLLFWNSRVYRAKIILRDSTRLGSHRFWHFYDIETNFPKNCGPTPFRAASKNFTTVHYFNP